MKMICLLVVLLTFSVADAFGQKPQSDEGPVGIFSSGEEYDQFMGGVKRLAYGPDGNPELRAMIPLLNDVALNQPIGSTAGKYQIESSTIGMLADDDIRGELEMVDGQYEELKRLHDEIQQRTAEQIRKLDFKDTTGLADQIRVMREQAQSDLNSLLLPHQLTRLKQIRIQSQLRRRSLIDILTSEPLKSNLEISDEQSRDLRDAEQEIEKELAREIASLREKARDRLLSRLKPGQRAEVEDMIGEAFDFPASAKDKSRGGKEKNRK